MPGSASLWNPSRLRRTRDRLHRSGDLGRSRPHRWTHTAHAASTGGAGRRSTPAHWYTWSTEAGRLNREHQLGKIPDHSCAHTVHSAATWWDPGRDHSGLETDSRSSSLGGNELMCILGSTVPSPPGLVWPLDTADKRAHSKLPVPPGTHTACKGYPPTSPRLEYV